MIDYEYIFKETISYYFKDELSLSHMNKMKVNTREVIATTLDEYLVCLNKGFINVRARAVVNNISFFFICNPPGIVFCM